MMIPSIHLNGSSADALLEQVCEAHEAVRLAIESLAKAAPNARDYYPQGPGAFDKAQDEHEGRMRHLHSVLMELQQLADAIWDRKNERSR